MQLDAFLQRLFTHHDDCAFAAAAARIEGAQRIVLLLCREVQLVSQSEIDCQFARHLDVVLYVHPVVLHLLVEPTQRNVPAGAKWNIQQVVGKAAAGPRAGGGVHCVFPGVREGSGALSPRRQVLLPHAVSVACLDAVAYPGSG